MGGGGGGAVRVRPCGADRVKWSPAKRCAALSPPPPRPPTGSTGLTPNERPHDCWQKMEKMTSTAMDAARLWLMRPSSTQKMPDSVCTTHSAMMRPRMPQRDATQSDSMPPEGRDTRLSIPKMEPSTPAIARLRWNCAAENRKQGWQGVRGAHACQGSAEGAPAGGGTPYCRGAQAAGAAPGQTCTG